jgi:peroxiredoxin Q/BCP
MKLKIFGMLVVLAIGLASPTFSKASNGIAGSNALRRSAPVQVGEEAPDFTLEGTDGNKVTLSSARGKMPTVIVFYRGSWCPFCARQLSELRSLLKPKAAVRLLAISVDGLDTTKEFAAKIASDGKGAINYSLLSDPDHKVIDAYGLHDPAYDGKQFDGIPRASVYVIDKNNRVAWMKIATSYRVRPTNADIRAALASLK